MARIDLVRTAERLSRYLHQELLSARVSLGPLGPDIAEAPDLTYANITLPVELTAAGCPGERLREIARALAAGVKEAKFVYMARMTMPDESANVDAVRPDREDWRLSFRLAYKPPDPIHQFGLFIIDVVGLPRQLRAVSDPPTIHDAPVGGVH